MAHVPNHGFVGLGDIEISDGEALLCVTLQSACCSSVEAGSGRALPGNWYFPSGNPVSSNSSQFLYTTRGLGVIRLHRNKTTNRNETNEMTRGIFHCELPDQTGINQTVYVGLYAFTVPTSGKH